MQRPHLRQADHPVAAHREGHRASASDAPHGLLNRREGFADDAGCDPGIAAIDEAEIVNRIEIV